MGRNNRNVVKHMPKYTYTDSEGITKLEPGEYTFTIDKAEEGISKAGGNPMMKLECSEVTSGARIFDNLVFTEKAAWKIDMLLKSIGYDLQKGQEVELYPEHLIGKRFRGVVEMEKQPDGKEFARITRIIPKKERTLKMEAIQAPAKPAASTANDAPAW
jgi:hypothetical protein